MNKEDLIKKCPLVFKNLSHIQCGNGWLYLLDKASFLIEKEIASLPEETRDEVYAVQLKEKFGSLRYYMNQSTPYIDGVISMAESMSAITCEVCGNPGKLRQGGWIKTRCDEHST